MMKQLFLFTASYPFGNTESFLEDEIHYLSSSFEKVIIVPLIGANIQTREVPDNCVVYSPIVKSKLSQYTKGLFSLRALPVFIEDFFSKKVYRNTRRLKTWFIAYILSSNILKATHVREIFKKINSNDICYFYWGKGANVLSFFYKGKAKFVSRFHGEWDLWEETSGGYGPIRDKIANSLDRIVLISQKGKLYFDNKYPGHNTIVCRLGSKDYGIKRLKSEDKIHVVSCSTVYPLKRVPLIYESVKELANDGYHVCWTHLGGGPNFEELKDLIERRTIPNLECTLIGNVSHNRVMDFYCKNSCDVFINMSTNEGVPVSIMEAISFDIPIVATNVGGTSEVVTSETGVLVGKNPLPTEVANAIKSILNNLEHYAPRSFWLKYYNADINYANFSKLLAEL